MANACPATQSKRLSSESSPPKLIATSAWARVAGLAWKATDRPACAIISKSLAPSPQAMTCSFFQSQLVGQAGQMVSLGGSIDNVADDSAGQLAAGNFQFVRGREIEAEFNAQALGEIGETAGQDGGA